MSKTSGIYYLCNCNIDDNMKRIQEIDAYIFDVLVPKYASFDAAHKEDHALTVIGQAMKLLDDRKEWLLSQDVPADEWSVSVDRQVLKMAAACHDLGLVNGRDRHHLDSGVIIRNDENLRKWFTSEEVEVIAQAAEDHRASGTSAPRTIYGMIVAEADRVIDTETIILRTLQFGQKHYPDLSYDEHIQRAVNHLKEKYGRGGYLKLWIPWSDNAVRLQELQDLIADESALVPVVRKLAAGLHLNL